MTFTDLRLLAVFFCNRRPSYT